MEANTEIVEATAPEKLKASKKEKFITIIINGKEKKISRQSQYILDMLTVDDE